MILKVGAKSQFWGDPYLNSTTVLFDKLQTFRSCYEGFQLKGFVLQFILMNFQMNGLYYKQLLKFVNTSHNNMHALYIIAKKNSLVLTTVIFQSAIFEEKVPYSIHTILA